MKSNYYAYIIKCNDGTRYYGHTNNLWERLEAHAKGCVHSTKSKRPIELVYFKEYGSRSEAYRGEMQLKNGKTRKTTIDQLINSFSKAKCQGFNSRF